MTKNDILTSFFNSESYLNLALTHKSWVNENPGKRESNERLEFLGDAILEYVVSKEIFQKLPDKPEGYLTMLRANIVNTVSLAKVALELELGNHLFLSKGEEDTGGRTNTSILANTVEAIIGGIYMDTGLPQAENFIMTHILKDLDLAIDSQLKDAKSRFQELVQSQGKPTPKYEVIEEDGPDHNKVFTVAVVVNGERLGIGSGKSKSEAAQQAAEEGLAKIGE